MHITIYAAFAMSTHVCRTLADLDATSAGTDHAAGNPPSIATTEKANNVGHILRLSEARDTLRREELVLEPLNGLWSTVDHSLSLSQPGCHSISCRARHERISLILAAESLSPCPA